MKRLPYIDCIKGIGIFLVVFCHIYASHNFFFMASFSFHVPIFFIVTGILFYLNNTLEKSYKYLIIHKIKTILYPYFTFSLLSYLFYVITKDYSLSKQVLNDTIKLIGTGTLWFLITLFISELLFFSINKAFKNRKISFIIFMIVFITLCIINSIFNIGNINKITLGVVINRIFIGYIFISCGYYFFRYTDKFINKHIILTIIIQLGLCYLVPINGNVDLRTSTINNPFLYFLISIGICFILCSLIKKLYEKTNIKVLEYFGKNSLIIFATHLIITTSVDRYLTGYLKYDVDDFFILINIFLIEAILIELFNRLLPFMLRFPSKK